MRETADAVIVGGGVFGVSIAYHLAVRQFGRIVLLERDSLGSGSTGLSVATIDFMTLHPSAVDLYARSSRFFRHCRELLGAECGFVETGSIIMAGPESEGTLRRSVKRMTAAGVDTQFLDLKDLAQLEPLASTADLAAASYTPHAGYADPVLTTQAFAGAAAALGVDIRQGEKVSDLGHENGSITGVETGAGFIEAPVVIVAAGAWSGELLQPIGIDLHARPVRHPVVCLRRPDDFGPPHHSLLDLTTGIYARPESDELTLAGSIDTHVGYDSTTPDAGMGYVEDEYVLWTMERLLHRYPILTNSEMCNGWAGVMTITPDWQPIIGGWSNMQGLYAATGFSGRGFQISPSAGELLAGLVAGDEWAASLLSHYTPVRFEADERIKADQAGESFGMFG